MEEREQNLSTRDFAGGGSQSDAPPEPAAERAPEPAAPPEGEEAPAADQAVATDADAVPVGTEAGAEDPDRGTDPRPADAGPPSEPPASGSQADDGTRGERAASTGEMAAGGAGSSGGGTGDTDALLPADENTGFQRRWEDLQTGFVDEPRRTVEQADELVAQVMQRLAEGFATERERLEQQWGRGEDVSTEDLRIALQRYRAFFQRLLSA